MARLKDKYRNEVALKLREKFSYKNIMQVPKIDAIVVNVGMGAAIQNIKLLENAKKEIGQITGQLPVITKAKKSIAGFKLRQGMPIGCKVTLRGDRMYEFLDRLITLALPRIKDFQGLSDKAMDGRGNYSLGIKEQTIFPEIEYDKVDHLYGMNIVIVTTAKTNAEGKALLQEMGMPFKKSV
jgi:large subunit ribosomal protein L5